MAIENTEREMELFQNTIKSVSVDCVIFGFQDAKLKVLVIHSSAGDSIGLWKLPGASIKKNESLEDAATRILEDLTGFDQIYLEQFRAFGTPDRYPLRRIITVAFFALVKPENHTIKPNPYIYEARWVEMHNVPKLCYDHNQIVHEAARALKHKVRHEPIGFNLLPEKFTLLQLQELYESILDIKLDKSNFRRKIMKMKLLVALEEQQQGVSHRAAQYFKFDPENYECLREKGFNFEI
jgi:hypothetical protein